MDNLQTRIQKIKDILKAYQGDSPLSCKKCIINKIWWLQRFSYKTVLLSFIVLYAKLSKFNGSIFTSA